MHITERDPHIKRVSSAAVESDWEQLFSWLAPSDLHLTAHANCLGTLSVSCQMILSDCESE